MTTAKETDKKTMPGGRQVLDRHGPPPAPPNVERYRPGDWVNFSLVVLWLLVVVLMALGFVWGWLGGKGG